MTPDQYCQQKAAQSGSSFYYSFLFLPPERRRAITALYAFCREVDDIVDECTDVGVARTKLGWWRIQLAALYEGRAEHPVAQALVPVVTRFNLPQSRLQEIIDGMEMDLTQRRYADFTALRLYCHRVAGVVGLLSAEIFGYSDPGTLKYAENLGMAFQLTNIIRDVGEDARRDRVYLPLDELARHRVSETQIAAHDAGEAWREFMMFQIERARSTLWRGAPLGRALRGRIGLEMRMIISGGDRVLTKIVNANCDIFRHRPLLRAYDWPLMFARTFSIH